MEHIGVIEEAGLKPQKPPKTGQNFCMQVSGWDKTYYINREEDTPLRELAVKLHAKTVRVKYEPSGKYRNVSAIEEVAPAPNTPVSPHGESNSMSKEEWAKKQRIEQRGGIAKAFIDADMVSAEGWQAVRGAADEVFAWVYELPQKPAMIPPVQEAKSKGALLNEILDFMKKYQASGWGQAKIRQEAMRLAGEQGWENSEEIAADSYKAMDVEELTHFVAFLKTEIAKFAK